MIPVTKTYSAKEMRQAVREVFQNGETQANTTNTKPEVKLASNTSKLKTIEFKTQSGV